MRGGSGYSYCPPFLGTSSPILCPCSTDDEHSIGYTVSWLLSGCVSHSWNFSMCAGPCCSHRNCLPKAPVWSWYQSHNSSFLCIADPKGCSLKVGLKNVRFTLGGTWVKFLSCQENSSVLHRNNSLLPRLLLFPLHWTSALRTSPVHRTGMWIYLTSGRLPHS